MKATLRHDDFMRERLADAQFAAGYLQSALEDGDLSVLLLALRRIAEARGGMTKLAQATGLTREALYRTLSAAGNPRLSSLAAILGATGGSSPDDHRSRRARALAPGARLRRQNVGGLPRPLEVIAPTRGGEIAPNRVARLRRLVRESRES